MIGHGVIVKWQEEVPCRVVKIFCVILNGFTYHTYKWANHVRLNSFVPVVILATARSVPNDILPLIDHYDKCYLISIINDAQIYYSMYVCMYEYQSNGKIALHIFKAQQTFTIASNIKTSPSFVDNVPLIIP